MNELTEFFSISLEKDERLFFFCFASFNLNCQRRYKKQKLENKKQGDQIWA